MSISIDRVNKTKYILLELKEPSAMSAISKTCNHGHKIL